jgi:hypothetical protein
MNSKAAAGRATLSEPPFGDAPRWHLPLDAHDWTDVGSNVASLPPAAALDEPRGWLGCGPAGADQVSRFLHDATHHWCLASPVALAIAGLNLRARLHIDRGLNGEGQQNRVARDLVKAETAVAVLSPFAEGLALFAEFDASSRPRNKHVSPVLRSLAALFALPGATAVTSETTTTDVLQGLRIDPATVSRKAGLLLKPFSLKGGAFLPGYLAVKSLFRAAFKGEGL